MSCLSHFRLRLTKCLLDTLWDAFDMLGLPQPPGHRHRAATDTMAMLMIWNWLEETQISNLLLSSRPGNGPIHYN